MAEEKRARLVLTMRSARAPCLIESNIQRGEEAGGGGGGGRRDAQLKTAINAHIQSYF